MTLAFVLTAIALILYFFPRMTREEKIDAAKWFAIGIVAFGSLALLQLVIGPVGLFILLCVGSLCLNVAQWVTR